MTVFLGCVLFVAVVAIPVYLHSIDNRLIALIKLQTRALAAAKDGAE